MSEYFDPELNRVTEKSLGIAQHVNDLRDDTGAAFDKFPASSALKTGSSTLGIDSGVVNAYVVTMPVTLTAYTTGMEIIFGPLVTNTGASTINVDSLGVKDIKRADGTDLKAGDLDVAGVIIRYNGTEFRVQGSIPVNIFTNLKNAKINAEASQSAAEASQAAAEASQAAAEASASVATTKAAEALASELSATSDESSVDTSKTNIAGYKTDIEGYQTLTAADRAAADTANNNALTSRNQAQVAESNASDSETAAGVSETNAGLSETAAAADETTAAAVDSSLVADQGNALGVLALSGWTLGIYTSIVGTRFYRQLAYNSKDKLICVVSDDSVGLVQSVVSDDGGLTYTEYAVSSPTLGGLIYGNETDNLFVGCHDTANPNSRVVTSADGQSFTNRTTAEIPCHAITYVPWLDLYIVAASGDNGFLTSPDAIVWTHRTPTTDFTGTPAGFAYSDDLIVAVGGNNEILTSTDGLTWTARTCPNTATITGVAYSPDLDVWLISQSNKVLTSSDGITWVATDYVGGTVYEPVWVPEFQMFIMNTTNEFHVSYDGTTVLEWGSNELGTLDASDLWHFLWVSDYGVLIGCTPNGDPEQQIARTL